MGRRVEDRPPKPAPRFEGFESTSARASATARAIRRTDTKAEIALRRALWALGVRYRKNYAELPGKPDLVLTRHRLVIFVDGDFWHGRDWVTRRKKLAQGSNAPYWLAKVAANMARDVRTTETLQSRGWRVLRVWETDVLRDLDGVVQAVLRAIGAQD